MCVPRAREEGDLRGRRPEKRGETFLFYFRCEPCCEPGSLAPPAINRPSFIACHPRHAHRAQIPAHHLTYQRLSVIEASSRDPLCCNPDKKGWLGRALPFGSPPVVHPGRAGRPQTTGKLLPLIARTYFAPLLSRSSPCCVRCEERQHGPSSLGWCQI